MWFLQCPSLCLRTNSAASIPLGLPKLEADFHGLFPMSPLEKWISMVFFPSNFVLCEQYVIAKLEFRYIYIYKPPSKKEDHPRNENPSMLGLICSRLRYSKKNPRPPPQKKKNTTPNISCQCFESKIPWSLFLSDLRAVYNRYAWNQLHLH